MRPNVRSRHDAHLQPTRPWVLRTIAVALLACAVAGAGFAIGIRAGSGQQPDAPGALRALLERGGRAQDVWIYDLATRTERQLTTKSNWGNANGGYREHPAWSKNGAYVMFSGKNSKNGYDLYQIRTDGAEKAIQVTSTSGSELYPAWGW